MSLLSGFATGAAQGVQSGWADNRAAAMEQAKEQMQMRLLNRKADINTKAAEVQNNNQVRAAEVQTKNQEKAAGLLNSNRVEAARVENANKLGDKLMFPDGQYFVNEEGNEVFVNKGDTPPKGARRAASGSGESGERGRKIVSLGKEIEGLRKSIADYTSDEQKASDEKLLQIRVRQLDSLRGTQIPMNSDSASTGRIGATKMTPSAELPAGFSIIK